MSSDSFSKRLRAAILENSPRPDQLKGRDILGLTLSLAGRIKADEISFISEQKAYLDYLTEIANLSGFPLWSRKEYKKGERLVFERSGLGQDFVKLLFNGFFVKKSSLSRQQFFGQCFLACGSLADPNLQFSLEFQLPREEIALLLQKRLADWSIPVSLTARKSIHVLYLKNSSKIADFLIICGATELLLEYIDGRVKREISAGVNRLMNCDEANSNRQVNTAARQLAAIRYIAAEVGLSILPDNLKKTAEARLQYPELSISELGQQMDPPLGKSGMNHRLRRLEEISFDLRLRRSSREGDSV